MVPLISLRDRALLCFPVISSVSLRVQVGQPKPAAWTGPARCDVRHVTPARGCGVFSPTGKSLLIFRIACQAQNKNIVLFRNETQAHIFPIPSCSEGRRPPSRL